MTTLHDCGGLMGRSLTLSLGLSQFHGHGSWLVPRTHQTFRPIPAVKFGDYVQM